MIGTNGNSSSTSYGSSTERRSAMRDEALAMRSFQAQETRRGGSGWPWAITGIALAFAAGLLANPWFEAKVRQNLPEAFRSSGGASGDAAADERLATIEARLAAIDGQTAQGPASLQSVQERLAALEARAGAPGAPVADTAALTERLAALESRIGTLEQTVTNAATQVQTLQSAHSLLDGRFIHFSTQVETRLGELKVEGDRARTLIVVAAARRALSAGQPIGGAVEALAKAHGADNPNVAALRAVANGAATPESLRRRLNVLKPVLLTAGHAAQGEGWFDRFAVNVKNLVQIRRVDEPAKPGDPLAALDAMDQRLARGDIDGALAVGRAMPAPMRAKAQPLLADMQALVAARQALTRLESAALAG